MSLIVLLASDGDIASMNIRSRLLEEAEWEPSPPCWGRAVLRRGHLVLMERPGVHLDFVNIDGEIRSYLKEQGLRPHQDQEGADRSGLDLIVFLSKHRSEREVDSLTVHPPGNYLEAAYGGREGTLPPSAPRSMTAALVELHSLKRAAGLADRTSFEVTHHGPYLETPSFFIEIGSGPNRWGREELARPIARTLLSDRFLEPASNVPVAIGIGGGHYAPRFSDKAIGGDLVFGHMVPDHILERAPDPARAVELALRSTPGATIACFHRTRNNEGIIGPLEAVAEGLGLRVMKG